MYITFHQGSYYKVLHNKKTSRKMICEGGLIGVKGFSQRVMKKREKGI